MRLSYVSDQPSRRHSDTFLQGPFTGRSFSYAVDPYRTCSVLRFLKVYPKSVFRGQYFLLTLPFLRQFCV